MSKYSPDPAMGDEPRLESGQKSSAVKNTAPKVSAYQLTVEFLPHPYSLPPLPTPTPNPATRKFREF